MVMGEEWFCRKHRSEGRRWADGGLPEVVLDVGNQRLTCGQHHEPVLMGETQVSLREFAADVAVIETARTVLVWTDASRDENLEVISSAPGQIIMSYQRGGPRIRVAGRPLKLSDISCSALAIAKGPHGEATATIPIRPEFAPLIVRADWLPSTRSWQLGLKGRDPVQLPTSLGTEEAGQDAGIVVWPRRRVVGWSGNVVGVFSRADAVAVIEELADGTLTCGPFVEPPVLVETQSSAAYIAFQMDGKPRGVLPVQTSNEPVDAASAALVAICRRRLRSAEF
jgi:hypothetical protein